ncbi:MAG TPA: Ku protein [Terriglobales bacterium]|nr:Ku protein [Terriglobales bacterium]
MAVVWSGFLSFGLVTIPVRLFSGARGERVGFHLLHASDHVRLKQQMICPREERPVGRDEIVRGYEYAKGEYVVVSEEEIKKAAPHTQKEMEIIEFCQAGEIDPLWFDASYYLLPEAAGRRPYRLLEAAMQASGYVAIAKITMHNREYHAVLRPSRLAGVPDGERREGLLLHTMFYADEIRVAEGFGETAAQAPAKAELDLARQLINGLAQPFQPERFHDAYRQNLEQVIAAKLEGRSVEAAEKPRRLAPVVDIMESLKRSLEQTRAKRAGAEPAAERAAAQPAPAAGRRKPPARAAGAQTRASKARRRTPAA